MLFKDSVGILKRANGTNTLLLQGRTADNTSNSLLIQDSANAELLKVLNDGEVRIDGNLTIGNYVNTNALGVSGTVELLGTVDITGNTSIVGDLSVVGNVQIQDGTETDGYVLTAGTNGEASWQAVPLQTTGSARTDTFTADGIATNFTLNFDPTYVYYISVNGIIQEEGVQYNINGVNLTFTDVLPSGYQIIASYVQNLLDVTITGIASDILYTPNDATDWSPQPVDVQVALDQLAARSVTMNISSTMFVTSTGNDTTAVKGDMSKPYQTIAAARAAAVTDDLIVVYPGTYNDAGLAASGSVANLNYFFFPGAKVVNTSATHIFAISAPFVTSVYGNGYFECTNTSANVAVSVTSSAFNFQFAKCKSVTTILIADVNWIVKGEEIECTGLAVNAVVASGEFEIDKIIHSGSSTGVALELSNDCNASVKEIVANNATGIGLSLQAGVNNANANIQSISSTWQGFVWAATGGTNCNIEIGSINSIDYAITSVGAGLSNSTVRVSYVKATTQIAVNITTSGNCIFDFGQLISNTSYALSIQGGDTRDIINVNSATGGADIAIRIQSSSSAPSSGVANQDLELNINQTKGRLSITAADSTYFYLSLIVNGGLISAVDYPISIAWESVTQATRLNLNNLRLRSSNVTASIQDAGGVSPELAIFYCAANYAADTSIINNGLPLVINSNV